MDPSVTAGITAIFGGVASLLTWLITARNTGRTIALSEDQVLMQAVLEDRKFTSEELQREREAHARTRQQLDECWQARQPGQQDRGPPR